ncbi:hypothetical protein H4R19_004789, partial [Coemansia spiralis]
RLLLPPQPRSARRPCRREPDAHGRYRCRSSRRVRAHAGQHDRLPHQHPLSHNAVVGQHRHQRRSCRRLRRRQGQPRAKLGPREHAAGAQARRAPALRLPDMQRDNLPRLQPSHAAGPHPGLAAAHPPQRRQPVVPGRRAHR